MLKPRNVIIFCIYLVFILSLANLLKILLAPTYFDFKVYYNALQLFLHGENPYTKIYFPFIYPPPVILFFYPFIILPLFIAGKIYVVLTFLCLFLSVILMLKTFNVPDKSLLAVFLTIFVANFFPAKFSLIMGQLNTIVLFPLALFVYSYAKKRPYLSGAALACAILLKFFPIFVIPFLLIDKQWKILASVAATFVLASFIVLLTIPASVINAFFTTAIPGLLHTGGGTEYYDQSLSAFMSRTFHSSNAVQFARIISASLLSGTYLIIWMFRKSKDAGLLSIGSLIILNIILSSFAWQHHYILLLVPLFIAFFYIRNRNLDGRFYLILLVSFFLMTFNFKKPLGFSDSFIIQRILRSGYPLWIIYVPDHSNLKSQ